MHMNKASYLMMAIAETPVELRYFAVIGGIDPRRRGVDETAVRAFNKLMIRPETCYGSKPGSIPRSTKRTDVARNRPSFRRWSVDGG